MSYHKFETIFKDRIFSILKIEDSLIKKHYEDFNQSKKLALEAVKGFLISKGRKFSDDFDVESYLETSFGNESISINDNAIHKYLEEVYGKSRLDMDGACLKENLIGKACQLNENEFGVVRGFDENSFLLIDFGGSQDVKVNVKKLIISGQKNS